MSRRFMVRAAVVALVLALTVPAAAQAAPFHPGFYEPGFTGRDLHALLQRASGVRARTVRLGASWSALAPSRPQDETDPGDPAYRHNWGALDAAVRAAVADGMAPMISVTDAPRWAEGADRPASALPNTWKPDAAAFGRLGIALARRYSGTYTPAGASSPLPRVRDFQAWNEPNLPNQLAPQWVTVAGRSVPAAPELYRGMLNAFAAGVHSVSSSDRVITAGLSPYGDPDGLGRMRPMVFWRAVFCLDAPCANPADFDILDHHPYSSGGPTQGAYDPGDVALADMPRLVALLRQAEAAHRLAGTARHDVWSTEWGWDSAPDPHGLSERLQAKYFEIGLYELWRAGVTTPLWYLVDDEPPVPSFAASRQSGAFTSAGAPKLLARAFAFPFITTPTSRSTFWGVAPRCGRVRIQRRTSTGAWKTIATASTPRCTRVFTGRVSWPVGATLRAVQGRATSLDWTIAAERGRGA